MATVTSRDGIAIFQIIVFPVLLVFALLIWKRVGWKAGSQIWRYIVALSLLRIAGSICSLLTISNPNNRNLYVAAAVCELIGTAPLLLTYIGLLRQIDTEKRLNPKCLGAVAIVCLIGLSLGIAGISITDRDAGPFRANGVVKAAMGVFIGVFVVEYLLAAWLAYQIRTELTAAQKKLFLAIGLSWPFLLIRIVHSAIGDFADNPRFAVASGDTTTYLCMNVLEEIIAMSLCVGFGMSAVFGKERGHKPLAAGEAEPGLEMTAG